LARCGGHGFLSTPANKGTSMTKFDLSRPLTVESMLIEGQRKLAYERLSNPEMNVEIVPSTELFVDICERLMRVERELDELS
jgi:hypothetical protein